jgi:hypothetical protein
MKEMIADAYVLYHYTRYNADCRREETDEETEEWEQEQIRRGAQAPIDAAPAQKMKEIYRPAPSRPPKNCVLVYY